MPFVRVSRDKRGYEHTYLIQPPKVLYWFRTPPGIKVGRAPFDRDTQQAIEAQNPGVAFDWPRIIATAVPPPIAKDVEHWRERRRVERAAKRARSAEAAEALAVDEPEIVDAGEDTAAEEVEVGENPELAPEPVAPVEKAAAAPATQQPSGAKRRRRRRGGRRRRRSGAEQSRGTRPENGALDRAKPPPDSSD